MPLGSPSHEKTTGEESYVTIFGGWWKRGTHYSVNGHGGTCKASGMSDRAVVVRVGREVSHIGGQSTSASRVEGISHDRGGREPRKRKGAIFQASVVCIGFSEAAENN